MAVPVMRFIGKSFNTQPPEGGWFFIFVQIFEFDGFNTQPPEGGWRSKCRWAWPCCCFNTQPPEGGGYSHCELAVLVKPFQHTAA